MLVLLALLILRGQMLSVKCCNLILLTGDRFCAQHQIQLIDDLCPVGIFIYFIAQSRLGRRQKKRLV